MAWDEPRIMKNRPDLQIYFSCLLQCVRTSKFYYLLLLTDDSRQKHLLKTEIFYCHYFNDSTCLCNFIVEFISRTMLFENRSILSLQRPVAGSALSFREWSVRIVSVSQAYKENEGTENIFRNLAEYLRVRIIFILSLSLSGFARQYAKKYLIFKELAGFFTTDYSAFLSLNHIINTTLSPPASCLRREHRTLSGGMRSKVIPCPYAAGMFYSLMSNRIQI